MAESFETSVVPLRWEGDLDNGTLFMLDQRRLPKEEFWHEMSTAAEVAGGIRDMIIRGAPAIGIAAAFGVFLGVRETGEATDELFDMLADTRPTAVNLFWALERVRALLAANPDDSAEARLQRLFGEANAIFADDRANNLAMGEHALPLFGDSVEILTHCNTGGLATGGYGTALGIIRALHAAGKLKHVWVDETRPYLQGARLTAWELMRDDIPCTLITDNMAAHFMQQGRVQGVVVGTDRVAANGDVANKIGTYGLAVLCAHHDIPFYVGAPISTIDLQTASGDDIEIEQRSAREVTHVYDAQIAPDGVQVAHPAFDVTPAELVTGIITEHGVATAPYDISLAELVESA
jgi:methylthioribose-1-phosphate isomerase